MLKLTAKLGYFDYRTGEALIDFITNSVVIRQFNSYCCLFIDRLFFVSFS